MVETITTDPDLVPSLSARRTMEVAPPAEYKSSSHDAGPRADRVIDVAPATDQCYVIANDDSATSPYYADFSKAKGVDLEITGTSFTCVVYKSRDMSGDIDVDPDYLPITSSVGGSDTITEDTDFTDNAGVIRNCWVKFVTTGDCRIIANVRND